MNDWLGLMSMIRCDLCGELADSDDWPEGFAILDGKDVFVCERCFENRERELEEDDE